MEISIQEVNWGVFLGSRRVGSEGRGRGGRRGQERLDRCYCGQGLSQPLLATLELGRRGRLF